MVLPVGDVPNERGLPLVTYLLIAVNVAVFFLVSVPMTSVHPDSGDPVLAEYLRVIQKEMGGDALAEAAKQVSQYDLFVFTHAFRPAAPTLEGLFLSMFLHAGFAHLFGNMLFLWIYGDNVEHRLGPMRMLVAYLGTGIAATLFHAIGDSSSEIPMIGASGAISGVLGLYFVWFPRNHVRLLVFLPPFLMNTVEVRARIVLAFYLVADNLLPYFLAQGRGGVAYGAHIGGFLAGVGIAMLARRRSVVARPADYRGAPREVAPDETVVSPALAQGRFSDAARAYFALPADGTRRLLDPSEAVALADWLCDHDHVDAALTVLRRALRDFPNAPGVALVHARLGEILLDQLDQPAMAYQHFMAAREAGPDPEADSIAQRGLAEIEVRQKRQFAMRRRAS
jgi:membrane associated rhomboid family serine protease